MSEKLVNEQAVIDVIDGFNVFESRGDQIALEIKIRELPSAEITLEQVKAYCEPRCLSVVTNELVRYWEDETKKLPPIKPPQMIINCKYCEHYAPDAEWCEIWGDITHDNAFCSYARRKHNE